MRISSANSPFLNKERLKILKNKFNLTVANFKITH